MSTAITFVTSVLDLWWNQSQPCIFDLYFTKPVGVNENLGGWEALDEG